MVSLSVVVLFTPSTWVPSVVHVLKVFLVRMRDNTRDLNLILLHAETVL